MYTNCINHVAQLNSLEKRLRITEERLRRVHDYSAAKLTDTEERLTTENAKLQVRRHNDNHQTIEPTIDQFNRTNVNDLIYVQ